MAVKTIATEPLDLSSADANGTPLAATDATHVDAITTPSDIASSGSAGTSFLAAPTDHSHKGVRSIKSDANAQLFGDTILASGTGIALTQVGNTITVAASSGAVNKLSWGDDREKSNVGTTEEILFEWLQNFDDAGSGAPNNIQARLTAFAAASSGTGTFNLYVGATAKGSTSGGTTRATVTATAAAFANKTNLGTAFANPGGMQIVQLTAVNSGAGGRNKIQGLSITVG